MLAFNAKTIQKHVRAENGIRTRIQEAQVSMQKGLPCALTFTSTIGKAVAGPTVVVEKLLSSLGPGPDPSGFDFVPRIWLFFLSLAKKGSFPKIGLLRARDFSSTNDAMSSIQTSLFVCIEDTISIVSPATLQFRWQSLNNLSHVVWTFNLV